MIVAVCTAAGSAGSTTTSVMLAASMPRGLSAFVAECDPSGGDLASWAQLSGGTGWASAVSASDRSWQAVLDHVQELPSGLRVMTAPPRGDEAVSALLAASRGFAGFLSEADGVVAVADCGRVGGAAPLWTSAAQLTLLLLRQSAATWTATAARVERTIEALEVLRRSCKQVGVVLVGGAPYRSSDIEASLGWPLFGVLPEDAAGAALVSGAWTVGRRAARSPLARATRELAVRVVEALYGRERGELAAAGGGGGERSVR